MKLILSLALVVPLWACSTTPPEAGQQQAAAKPDMVCTREAPTGRLMPTTTCRRVEDIERRRDEDRQAADRIQVTPHDVLTGR